MPGFSKLTNGLLVVAAVLIVAYFCFAVGNVVATWPAAMAAFDWVAEYFPLLLSGGAILTVILLFASGYCSTRDPDQPPSAPQL